MSSVSISATVLSWRILTILGTASAAQEKRPSLDISGQWVAAVVTDQGSGNPTFTFKQEGETLTGTYKGQFGEAPLKGTVKGNDITFNIKVNAQGQDLDITYTGKVDGNNMKGKAVLGQLGEATWTAKKNSGVRGACSASPLSPRMKLLTLP